MKAVAYLRASPLAQKKMKPHINVGAVGARMSTGLASALIVASTPPLAMAGMRKSDIDLALRAQIEREICEKTGHSGVIVWEEQECYQQPTVEELMAPLKDIDIRKQLLPKEDLKGHRPFYEAIAGRRRRKR